MTERELAQSIILLTNYINKSVETIKESAPKFLLKRYSFCNIEYLDTFLSIIDNGVSSLAESVIYVYTNYFDKQTLEIIYLSSLLGEPIAMNADFYENLEKAKDEWFSDIVMVMDEILHNVGSGDFTN